MQCFSAGRNGQGITPVVGGYGQGGQSFRLENNWDKDQGLKPFAHHTAPSSSSKQKFAYYQATNCYHQILYGLWIKTSGALQLSSVLNYSSVCAASTLQLRDVVQQRGPKQELGQCQHPMLQDDHPDSRLYRVSNLMIIQTTVMTLFESTDCILRVCCSLPEDEDHFGGTS